MCCLGMEEACRGRRPDHCANCGIGRWTRHGTEEGLEEVSQIHANIEGMWADNHTAAHPQRTQAAQRHRQAPIASPPPTPTPTLPPRPTTIPHLQSPPPHPPLSPRTFPSEAGPSSFSSIPSQQTAPQTQTLGHARRTRTTTMTNRKPSPF